jgi:hypothetical protein
VSTNAARAPSPTDATSAFWLEKLKEAHAELLQAIDELAELTRGLPPGKDLLVDVRWNVSKASLARRLLWGRIHAHLAGRVDESKEADLRNLQEMEVQLFRYSATHVARWTTELILDDWDGYRQASALMRSKMIDGVAAERRVLYPMLAAVEGRSW